MSRRRTTLIVIGAVLVVLVGAALWQRANPFSIETRVEIDASPEVVWRVLTDFDRYPDWNPALVGMTGDLVVDGTLTFSTSAESDALTFSPQVLEVTPNRALRWEGNLLVVGLFDGEHQFLLEPTDAGGTVLVQREDFRGIAVPFTIGFLESDTRPQFEAMNAALKEQAEGLRE